MKPSDALARSGSAARSWPLTRIRPAVGLSSPAIIRMRGGLAGAVRTEEAVDLARRHVEADAVDRGERAVLLDEIVDGDHGRRPVRGPPTSSRRPLRAAESESRARRVGRAAGRPGRASRRRELEIEDRHLQAADERQDRGLLVEAAAGQPQVRGVGGKLVQGRDRPAATSRARSLRRCTPRARRGSRTRRGPTPGRRQCAPGCSRARAIAT